MKAKLDASLEKRPLAKAQAMFFQGLKKVGGDESKMRAFHEKLQISVFLGREIAAKFSREGEGRADDAFGVKIMYSFYRRSF